VTGSDNAAAACEGGLEVDFASDEETELALPLLLLLLILPLSPLSVPPHATSVTERANDTKVSVKRMIGMNVGTSVELALRRGAVSITE
jgi:hypothetical protein